MGYQPLNAISYAHKWANARNPKYYNFDKIGGDCTNFISQCIYAGCRVMNYKPEVGWYYNSVNSRSAAWSSVEYLYKFLTNNKGAGPYGHEAPLEEASPGDIIQLSFDGRRFSHSLFIVDITSDNAAGMTARKKPEAKTILIATHSFDADNRALNTYTYNKDRLIKLDGAR